MAKAYAFRAGLVLAHQAGLNTFTIQIDCIQVMETMKQGGFIDIGDISL
jgi:hypothetical protein